jgi:beta-glucosidase
MPLNGRVTARVDVENTGSRAGDEVVQLYIHRVASSVTPPVKQLKGFERVTLQPGEKRTVQFSLGPEELGFYNREMKFAVESGKVEVLVGSSSEDVIGARFELIGK